MAPGQGQPGSSRPMPGPGEERGGAGGSATPWSALELLSQQQDRDDAGAEQPKGAATAAAAAAAAAARAPSKPLDVGAPRSSQHHTQEAVHAPAPSTSLSMSPLTKIEEKNLSKVHASPALMGQTSTDSEPRRVSDVDSESAIDDTVSTPSMGPQKMQRASSTGGIFDLDAEEAASSEELQTTPRKNKPKATTSTTSTTTAAAAKTADRPTAIASSEQRSSGNFIDPFAHGFRQPSQPHHHQHRPPQSSSSTSSDFAQSSPSKPTHAAPIPVPASASSTASSSLLAAPTPIPTAISPVSKHPRSTFDSTPSFSSPLAYASTLPSEEQEQEQAEDLDLDAPAEHVPRPLQSMVGALGEALKEQRSVSPTNTMGVASSSLRRERSTSARARLLWDRQDTSSLQKAAATSSRFAPSTASSSSSVSSPSLQKDSSAVDSPMSPPSSTPSSTAGAPGARRKVSGIMGPPLSIPRKSSGASSVRSGLGDSENTISMGPGQGDHDDAAYPSARNRSITTGARQPSGGSEENFLGLGTSSRSVSGSTTGSSASGDSPVIQQQPLSAASLSHSSTGSTSPPSSWQGSMTGTATGGPQASRRMRNSISSSSFSSNAHRRAKSLGGALLGEAATAIGGPDGVDPKFVAALRASDAGLPSTPVRQEAKPAGTPGDTPAKQREQQQHFATSPRNASLPSTPSGSVRLPSSASGSARKPELLSVLPDTRVLATSYPSVQMPSSSKSTGSEGSARTSPASAKVAASPAGPQPLSSSSSSGVPEGYVRSRVRSQTTAAPLTSTFAGPSQMAASLSRSSAPLGEAIRLQPMPSSVRNAGDIYTPSSPLISRHERRLSMAQPSPAQGLGIGGLVIPQTPNATRSPSPLGPLDPGNASSASTSGQSSPVVRARKSVAEGPWQRTSVSGSGSGPGSVSSLGPAPSPTPTPAPPADLGQDEDGKSLSVSIPAFRPDYNTPSSAMPALHYEGSRAGANANAPLPSPQAAPRKLPPVAARTPSASGRFEVPDLDARYDPTARPAPWIASSQEVRNSRLGTTSRIDRPGSSSGRAAVEGSTGVPQAPPASQSQSGQGDPLRSSVSVMNRQGGIDEYARIIIQSRNAKMQKWRAMASKNPRQALVPLPSSEAEDLLIGSSPDVRENLLSSSVGAGGMLGVARDDPLWRHQSQAGATPNVSPAGSHRGDTEDQEKAEKAAGNQEIEWVDWLDEYRRLKEAKLLSERQGRKDVDADGDEEMAEAEAEEPPSKAKAREGSPLSTLPSDLSRSLSKAMGFSDQRSESASTSRPRRPSEMPTRASKFAQESELRRSSSGLLPVHGEDYALTPWLSAANPPSSSSSTMNRRSILVPEKTRNLSLSPITSRITSSGSQQSATSTGRRKKLLGGKIEAWWGAVKSGFGSGLGTSQPLSSSQGTMEPGRSFSGAGTTGAGGMGRRVITPSSTNSDMQMGANGGSPKRTYKRASMAPVFSSQAYNQAHTRAQTNLAADTGQSVHTLRAASSAQNLKALPSRAATMDEDTPISPSSSSQTSEGVQSQGGASRRRQPQLSLHFEKGQSSFDAGPFERITPARTTPSTGGRSNVSRAIASSAASSPAAAAAAATAAASSSPSPTESIRMAPSAASVAAPRGGSTKSWSPSVSPKAARQSLSDAWHPPPPPPASAAATTTTAAAAAASDPSQELRGRSKHRKKGPDGETSSSRDITFQSIREHIHNRLAGSKESCDKELRKIVTAVNAFVEESILQREEEEEEQQLERERERERAASIAARLEVEGAGSASTDSEGVFTVDQTSHALPSGDGEGEGEKSALLTPADEHGSMLATPRQVQSGSPKHDYRLPKPPTLGQVQAAAAAAAAASAAGPRSLSRQALQRTRSRDPSDSRDTSRSHSPMPGAQLSSSLTPADSPQYSPARRIRPLPTEDAPLDPYIPALQDIVSIAVDVIDTSIHSLTARPGACSEIIAKVQDVGRNWDEHSDWPGRGWYVQLLLAVAGLSRVVEWWEAEKGFWNFEGDDDDAQDAEPIRFIVRGGGHHHGEGGVGEASHSPARLRSSTAGFAGPLSSSGITATAITNTPSAYSSGTSSPAMEPWDRRNTGESGERSRLATAHTQSQDSEVAPMAATYGPFPRGQAAEATSTEAGVEKEKAAAGESANVLMELSLDGERFLYLSPAWHKVIGSDPLTLFDHSISELLAAGDASTFAEATSQLQANDSHTVEAAFRLRVEHEAVAASLGQDVYDFGEQTTFYQEMEGYGMLMHDRLSGMPSHTMWVFKPVSAPEAEADLSPAAHKPSPPPASTLLTTHGEGSPSDAAAAAAAAAAAPLDAAALAATTAYSMEPILCRICERDIPTGFFEKHSEICHEVHRLEMEVAEANETLAELRRSTRVIIAKLDEEGTPGAEGGGTSTPSSEPTNEAGGEEAKDMPPAEYRSIALSTPPASAARPSALEAVNRSLSPRHANPAAIRKIHLRALDTILDILRTAGSISTPGTKDDAATSDEGPIEKQRLLSPESEGKVVQVRNWRRPATGDDAALDLLCSDVETATRSKLSAVNRMLNTIFYVETVRMEWESRVEAVLAGVSGPEEGSVGSEGGEDASAEEKDSSAQGHSEMDASEESKASGDEEGEGDDDAVKMTSREPQTTEEQDEVDEVDASALLLEEPETPAASAATPGMSKAVAATDDEIPALEGRMGGSSLEQHQTAIPIPTSTRRPVVASPAAGPTRLSRQSSRDVLDGAQSGGSIDSPQLQAQPHAHQPRHQQGHSRRESVIASAMDRSLIQTPPLSPFHSPLEINTLTDQRKQHANRRISVSHRLSPHLSSSLPLSPRMGPMAPSSRPTASSIKDFEIIKPISKGAFGSVFLAKKRTTGDYYAIKVLKKSDMIAKNQITNVKAERMILMTQTQSPFAVKLFFTFQSAEYLYLVMEYLPGGDCSSLVKNLGGLSEEWAKQFMAEIVNGLEHLHAKGIVHRDMKPDNLLIDQRGHLKLTDFGLSKIGLLGRQTRQQMATRGAGLAQSQQHQDSSSNEGGSSLPSSAAPITPSSAMLEPKPATSRFSIPETPVSNMAQAQTFYVGPAGNPGLRSRIMSASTDASDSSSSEGANKAKPMAVPGATTPLDSPSNIFGVSMLPEPVFGSSQGRTVASVQQTSGPTSSGSGAQLKKFVGTPDYLAPESILGLGMDDAAVDWWALGVILYEFLYGYPPFHADTPEKVFDNILSRNIDWEEDIADISPEARDLMERLMRTDRKTRLGTQGAEEIKRHPFFEGIDWDNLTKEDGPFVPQITDPESTDYFDLRGAVHQEFSSEVAESVSASGRQATGGAGRGDMRDFARAIDRRSQLVPSRPPSSRALRMRLDRAKTSEQPAESEFGPFFYKNLPVLKEANDQILRKIRTEPVPGQTPASEALPVTTPPTMPTVMSASTQAGPVSIAHSASHTAHGRHGSMSSKAGPVPVGTPTGASAGSGSVRGPPSPSTSVSSHSSVPSRSTAPTSPSGLPLLHKSTAAQASGLSHSKSLSRTQPHRRRPSELSASANNVISVGSPSFSSMAAAAGSSYGAGGSSSLLDRKRSQLMDIGQGDDSEESGSRRSSMPSRLRTTSMSATTGERPALAVPWQQQRESSASPQHHGQERPDLPRLATTTGSLEPEHHLTAPEQRPFPQQQAAEDDFNGLPSSSVACLIAEDNPIALKMLETILSKLGFGPITCVRNGAEAVRLAMSDVRFAILFVDVRLPIVNGQDVARMVKSTRNVNSVTPIVALVSSNSVLAEQQQSFDSGAAGPGPESSGTGAATGFDPALFDASQSIFDAVLAKPVEKTDVCAILPRLGFQEVAFSSSHQQNQQMQSSAKVGDEEE